MEKFARKLKQCWVKVRWKYQVLLLMNPTCAVSAQLKNFKDEYSTEKHCLRAQMVRVLTKDCESTSEHWNYPFQHLLSISTVISSGEFEYIPWEAYLYLVTYSYRQSQWCCNIHERQQRWKSYNTRSIKIDKKDLPLVKMILPGIWNLVVKILLTGFMVLHTTEKCLEKLDLNFTMACSEATLRYMIYTTLFYVTSEQDNLQASAVGTLPDLFRQDSRPKVAN